MKRNEIVEKLIKEGFSEKTLVKFTDKQLSDLSSRILGEQVTPMPPKQPALKIGPKGGELPPSPKGYTISQNPTDKTIIAVAKESEVSEEKDKESKSWSKINKAKADYNSGHKLYADLIRDKIRKDHGFEPTDNQVHNYITDVMKKLENPDYQSHWLTPRNKVDQTNEVKNWLETIAENNFHSFTSKNEIMELIKTKINEVEVGPNVKKGHNGVPEFMSYDAISNTDVKEAAPTTKPAPTKPKVEPGTKPKTPYQPGPGKDPKPKALKEKENADK